jgi:hypothetical protein
MFAPSFDFLSWIAAIAKNVSVGYGWRHWSKGKGNHLDRLADGFADGEVGHEVFLEISQEAAEDDGGLTRCRVLALLTFVGLVVEYEEHVDDVEHKSHAGVCDTLR